MPTYKNYDDIIDQLMDEVVSLRRDVRALRNIKTPSVPIYDWDAQPVDAVDGQVAIMENVPPLTLAGTIGPHKNTHVSGGSDAFTSTDILEAAVRRLRETSAILLIGDIADGQFLKRVGTGIVGATAVTTSSGILTDTFWDAKGDIAVGTGPDAAARLPVGPNGYTIVADDTETLGVKWAAAPAGAAVPIGGSTGMSLVKLSDLDYDVGWAFGAGGAGGGIEYETVNIGDWLRIESTASSTYTIQGITNSIGIGLNADGGTLIFGSDTQVATYSDEIYLTAPSDSGYIEIDAGVTGGSLEVRSLIERHYSEQTEFWPAGTGNYWSIFGDHESTITMLASSSGFVIYPDFTDIGIDVPDIAYFNKIFIKAGSNDMMRITQTALSSDIWDVEFTSALRDFYCFASEDFDIEVGGAMWLMTSGVSSGTITIDSGAHVQIDSVGDTNLQTGGDADWVVFDDFTIASSLFEVSSGQINLISGSNVEANLGSGGFQIVRNVSGVPIFRIDEATGNVHMKSGATIVDDL